MDLPALQVELEGTLLIDAPWGVAGKARFAPRHDAFVLVLPRPAGIESGPPGPRVLASSSTWVAVEDCIGVTAAALLATVGLDRVDLALRRFIWRVAVSGDGAIPRTDQIWLGFDGRVVITVPPRVETTRPRVETTRPRVETTRPRVETTRARDGLGDHDAGLLALTLEVDPTAGSDVDDDGPQRPALIALLQRSFPTQARAWSETLERARRVQPPKATPTASTPAILDATTALARLRALDARPWQVPPHGFRALPAVIDDDDDTAWRAWRPAGTRPPPPTPTERARLNNVARVHRIAATFGRVLEALAQTATGFVSLGGPWDVLLTADGCDFRDDERRRAAPAPPKDDSHPAPFQFRYVPPEQAMGSAVDIRASLYVVGIHLYEALGGRHPFWSASAAGFAALHAKKAAPPLEEVNPEVHAGLASVTMTLLRKDPAGRFATPELALVALARAIIDG